MHGNNTRYLMEMARYRSEQREKANKPPTVADDVAKALGLMDLTVPDKVLAEDAAVAAKHKAENDAERAALDELTERVFERRQEENSERANGGEE